MQDIKPPRPFFIRGQAYCGAVTELAAVTGRP